jgi:ArsR family transcriptional regulator
LTNVDECTNRIDKRQYIFQEAGMARTTKRIEVLECCPSVLGAPLEEAEAAALARGFAALADPGRLRLLNLLAATDAGEVCACDFVEPLGKSQPTVSHHLKVLSEAGLITGDKRGRWVWYSIVPEQLESLRAALAAAR